MLTQTSFGQIPRCPVLNGKGMRPRAYVICEEALQFCDEDLVHGELLMGKHPCCDALCRRLRHRCGNLCPRLLRTCPLRVLHCSWSLSVSCKKRVRQSVLKGGGSECTWRSLSNAPFHRLKGYKALENAALAALTAISSQQLRLLSLCQSQSQVSQLYNLIMAIVLAKTYLLRGHSPHQSALRQSLQALQAARARPAPRLQLSRGCPPDCQVHLVRVLQMLQ